MVGNVTLTASMRANLYSLQQTTQLMGTIQGRLATGKKVNSALDNPNNYFSAQNLSNRASDLSNLLDGMGQAIQAITQASNSITSAQKIVDQMKATANSAIQSATSSSSGAAVQAAIAQGTPDTVGTMVASAGSTALTADGAHKLINLTNGAGANLGIVAGDTLVSTPTAGAAVTFTVTADTTMKDLQSWVENTAGHAGTGMTSATAAITAAGKLSITVNGTGSTLSGTLQTKLGLTGAAANGVADLGTTVITTGPTQIATSDASHLLTSLTDANGKTLGIANGQTLTFQEGTGAVLTFTVGGSNASNAAAKDGGGSTLNDLQSWLHLQGTTVATSSIAAGKLTITNNALHNNLTIGGTLGAAIGVSGVAAVGGALAGTVAAYVQPTSGNPTATTSTLLRDLTKSDGSSLYNGLDSAPGTGGTALGNTITVTTYNGANVAGLNTITISDGMTVQDLLTKINAINPQLKASLDGSGHLVVDNQTNGQVDFGGTAQGLFENNVAAGTAKTVAINVAGSPTTLGVSLYAGYNSSASSSATGGVPAASYSAQFDTLRTQLDQLVNDSTYQGINLISGVANSPLVVTFSEQATKASSLVINAVDMTSTGLGVKAASGSAVGAWATTDAVKSALSDLTNAATTLRTQSAVLGTNLSTVQTRQDFTNNMIATLKAGSDSLTLADMNEESANMLALQTRSQLGTQALSLANQANQSVMRLFQ